MAETFLAVRRGPGDFEQHVCVKRILPELEDDDAFVHLFLEEARVSAQLRHAGIAQVLDFGVADGAHYLALELVEGLDLHRLLRRLAARSETLSPELVTYLASQLAAALEYAHGDDPPRPSVVHRDVSPSNVLIGRAGEVKLTDFGIAKAMRSTTRMTTTGHLKGKVPYMAPEYARSGRASPRSDLFSLGVVLHEALAGRRPFVGATEIETMQNILAGVRPDLASLCPAAPPALLAVIDRLLAIDEGDRFENAAAVLDALPSTPTARRALADLVRRLDTEAPPGTADDAASSPVEPTLALTTNLPASADATPTPAGPDDETRTRRPPARPVPAPPTPMPADVAAPFGLARFEGELTATAVGPALAAQLSRVAADAPAPLPGPPTLLESEAPVRGHDERARPAASPARLGPGRRALRSPRRGRAWGVLAIVGAGVLLGLGVLGALSLLRPRPEPPSGVTGPAAP